MTKKDIKLTKSQFNRLINEVKKSKATLNECGYKSSKEMEEGYSDSAGRSEGDAAAEGLKNIIDAIQKGYKFVTDPETKRKVKEVFQQLADAAGAAAGAMHEDQKIEERKRTSKPVIKK